jgi:ParB-like chromosome segregation protein Spo0J
MHVDLRTLQPNPLRDFTIDPMDPEAIVRLKLSIEQDGFWGGVVCRQLPDGTLQVGAGHHRVAAALAAGITEADLFVAEAMDDAALIRVYARENATQRGVSSTALAGTVAAAMKYVAKGILTGTGFAEKFFCKFDMRYVRSRLLGEDGMGAEVLLAFLDDIPGINVGSIKHQLANLKYSGDYARLMAEVQQEIATEKAAEEAQDLARQASQAAAMKYVAKGILTGTGVAQKFLRNFDMPTVCAFTALAAVTVCFFVVAPVPLRWRLRMVSRMSARTWSSRVSTASANSPSARMVEGATLYSSAKRSLVRSESMCRFSAR